MTSKLMGLHQHELVETAKLFSSKGSKVNVVFDDGGARTDGNTIWLPASPPDVALSEKGQRFDRAMVDHEASHHDVTNMKEFTTGVSGGDRRLEGLVQAIEDCRVDKNAIIKHPGARKNLGTARDMAFEGSAELIEATKDARHFAGTGIINAWWEKHGGWPSLNRKRAFEALPPEMQDFCRKYAELADELSLKRTTKPTVELAEQALAELLAMGETPPEQEQEQEPGPGPEQEQEGDDEGEQEQEQGQDEAEGADDDDQGDSDGSDGEAGFDAGDDIESTELAKVHGRMMESEAEGWEPHEIYAHDGRAANATVETNRFATRADWDATKGRATKGMKERYKRFRFEPSDWQQRWSETMAAVRSSVSKTQAKLTEAFMATSQRNWGSGYDSGALDPRGLVRAYQGRDGAFRRKDSGEDINAAVTLLMDCSGSMGGDPEEVAGAMTVALALVLERMGVAVEVRGFTSNPASTALDMVMKPFDMSCAQCRFGLGMLRKSAIWENHDYLNVKVAASSLMERHEAKRLLIVLSDGAPIGYAKELRKLCEALHHGDAIELLGVGIQDYSVERYYPNSVVVRKLEELSTVVAERIAKTLLGRGLKITKEAA